MKLHAFAVSLFAIVLAAAPLHAQSSTPAPSMREVLLQGANLLDYLELASQQGVLAGKDLLVLFSEEERQRLGEICRNIDLKEKQLRGEGKRPHVDASMQEDLAALNAELQRLLQDDKKKVDAQKQKAIRTAYKRLGLMLLADAQASLEIPATLATLTGALDLLLRNPFELKRHGRELRTQIALLRSAGTMLPSQVKSVKGVRGQVRKIADYNKMKMPADDTRSVKTVAELQKGAAEVELQ